MPLSRIAKKIHWNSNIVSHALLYFFANKQLSGVNLQSKGTLNLSAVFHPMFVRRTHEKQQTFLKVLNVSLKPTNKEKHKWQQNCFLWLADMCCIECIQKVLKPYSNQSPRLQNLCLTNLTIIWLQLCIEQTNTWEQFSHLTLGKDTNKHISCHGLCQPTLRKWFGPNYCHHGQE